MATRWSNLAAELQERVAEHLPGNEVACSLRLINKAAAELFRDAAWVRLSEPVPPHAFVWRWGSPAAYRSLTLKSRRQVMALTAESGVLSNLQVAVAAAGCSPTETVVWSAAYGCHLHICEWLAGQGYYYYMHIAVEAAASQGHFALLRWLLDRWPREEDVAVYSAAGGGHAELVQWLLPVKGLDDHKLLQNTAYGCDLAGLQHVYGNLSSVQQNGWRQLRHGGIRLLLAALTSPTPDWRAKVDWLRDLGCALNNQTASESGFTLPDALQPGDRIERARLYLQLLPEGVRAGAIEKILTNALRLAAPELMDFALEQWPHAQLSDLVDVGCSRGTMVAINECAERFARTYEFETSAQVVLTSRLAAAGVPIWPTVVKAAIQTGSLQMLQWMAAGAEAAGQEGAAGAGLPVAELEGLAGAGPEVRAAAAAALRAALEEKSGADLASLAADTGNLEIMQWLRAHGCAWNAQTFTKAVLAGNVALLEWMVEEGFPLPDEEDASSCYERAIWNKDLAVLQCLRRLGVPWGPRERHLFGLAVSNGRRVEVLTWLLDEGCAVDWQAYRTGNTAEGLRAIIKQWAR